jgi:XTP/dITP diphosphohydrolase
MRRLLVATYNAHKREEIKTLLSSLKGLKVVGLDELKIEPFMIVEDGKTFRANAIKKSVTMSKFLDGLVLADDSGLEVDALDGRPGVRSARFSRKNATDEENNEKLLMLMNKIPEGRRTARFVCNLALSEGGKLLECFEGEIKGIITLSPRGDSGFGYDPLFIPEKYEQTFGEMDPARKNKISHRAEALRSFKKAVKKFI